LKIVEKKRNTNTAADIAEHELVGWVHRMGVEAHLSDPVSELAPFVEGGSANVDSVRNWSGGDVRRAALGLIGGHGIAPHEMKAAAKRYLDACAADAAQAARRQMLWRRTPESEALSRIADQLRALEQQIHAEVGAAQRISVHAIQFEESVPCLMLPGHHDATRPDGEIRLVLTGHERGELSIEPSVHHGRRGLALIRAALDAVHDPSHPLHARLAEALSMPAWRRLVSSIEEYFDEEDENENAETRLVFRVKADSVGTPSVELVQQRKGARGRFTKGVRVEPVAALASFVNGPAEALALRALSERDPVKASAEALYALADADAIIVSDETNAPLEIRRVEARFALTDEKGGLRAALALGETNLPIDVAALRSRNARAVAHVNRDRDQVLVAPLDSRLAGLVFAAARYPALVPDAERSLILPLVERVAARVPIALSKALESEVEVLEPALFVRITPEDDGATVELRTRLSPNLSAPVGEGTTLVSVFREGTAQPVLRRRDFARERTEANVLAHHLHMTEGETRAHLGTEDAVFALLAALHERPEIEVEWSRTQKRARYVGAVSRVHLRVRVKSAAEWFGVEGEIEVDGELVSLADLLKAVRAGRRYLRLSRGRFASIEADLRARLSRAADAVFTTSRGDLAISAAAGDALEALAAPDEFHADEAWMRIRARLAALEHVTESVPETLTATLRDYQLTGFHWLTRLSSVEVGAVLADDMGLGKTVQALALLAHRASEGPAIVVAPTSLGDNWAREASRFAPSLRIRVHRGPARKSALESEPLRAGDVLIASYDVVALDIDSLSELEFGTLVLDEAQAVKNPDALRTKAVRQLRARAKVALTGTPLENRLSELWSIVSIVHPGLLGTWEHFRDRFASPIERDGDRERLAALAELVRPYLLRRTKEVVTPELPPRVEMLREVELGVAERRLYEAERNKALEQLTSVGETERFRVLATITRLRQLACDPALVVPDAAVASSKLAALMELVDELESAGRKVLVFSQFVRLLERVAELLRNRRTKYLMLDGSTPATERVRLVDAFQTGDATVFLLSLKAGGMGLNLTAADTVVHLDPWWNPAVEDQASDRAHRIGQDKSVTIIRLVAKETIEEAVLALHDSKRALTQGVLEGADAAGALSAAELVDLIRNGAPSTR
jgi:superfamily II DNA or RNA helicase